MAHFQTGRRQRHVAWRIIPVTVLFCLALSGTGAQLAISILAPPECPLSEEEIGNDSEVRRIARPRLRLGKCDDTAVQHVPFPLAALRQDRCRQSQSSPTAFLHLVGAGIKLRC